MKRPRIHFHSDCSFFAGCENMLASFFNSESFTEKYDVTFSYRSSPEYEKGFKDRVKGKIKTFPLRLWDMNEYYSLENRVNIFAISWIWKALIKLIGLPMKYIFIFRNMFLLKKVFGNMGIDILHINNGGYPGAYSCMSAVFAARLAGIKKIVYVVNNIAAPYLKPARILDYPLDRIVARSVTVFITGSKNAGGYLKKVLRLPDEKILNIPNGIFPRKVTESPARVLQRLGLKNTGNRMIAGIVAIMEERKGHRFLIEAFHLLKISGLKNMPILLIEGNGPKLEELKKMVDVKGLGGDIRFIGNEKNVFNFINAIDVFILPSISNEDFPNVTLEAMSLVKPVIATNIAGIPEQIENNRNGILVSPRDPQALADAVKKMASDKTFLKKAGKGARARFEKTFTSNVAVNNYDKLYNSLINKSQV